MGSNGGVRLQVNTKAVDAELLARAMAVLMPEDYCLAVQLCVRFAEIYAKQSKFGECLPLVKLVLEPTIFEVRRRSVTGARGSVVQRLDDARAHRGAREMHRYRPHVVTWILPWPSAPRRPRMRC